MELAQLLVTPTTLLMAFIFFWKQAKTGREELRRELKSDMRELKSDMKEMKEELKEEIASVRNDVASHPGRNARHERTARPRRGSADDL